MPTIKQLPAATAVGANDLLPVSQNGLTRSTTVSTLLSNTQPLLSLAQGTLLGRVSIGLGGPEAVSVGIGLSVQSGTVVATAADHVRLSLATSLLADDEVVVNSGAAAKRLPATQLRSLFSAGAGVQIDSNGVISSTSISGGSGSAGPKGDAGPQGPMGQGFTFRGPWQPTTSYVPYDIVTNSGQAYVAAVLVPATSTFNAASWSLIAAQGSTGATGATGPIGPGGPTLAATASVAGAVKPGVGLTVAADGTLSISSISLATISQGSAAVGQLLGWSGTGWAPTTPASGINFTGAAPITVASGVISLGQSGAAVGQVLTWNGTAWIPQQIPASGAAVGTALPLSDGVAGAGSAATASREDHRHPTDLTRAPLVSPVFTTSITLPIWTAASRPASPAIGMEGYASDTSRRETYTSSGWVQYVRVSDIPAASGQLLGATAAPGAATAVAVGSGLSLVAGTLSVTPAAGGASVSGIAIDGTAIAATVTSPYQMANTDRVIDVNKAAGSATKILLPTNPTLWIDYNIVDGKGDAGTNNITISLAAGGTINGQAIFLMNANYDAITLRAVSPTVWRVA